MNNRQSSSNRNFASDNGSGIHPAVLDAIRDANAGHAKAYGGDPWTARARAKFDEVFGGGTEAFFVFNGTAANVLGLSALLKPWNAVICAESAHIENDECGAPERFLSSKLIKIPAPSGKITPESIAPSLSHAGDVHRVQPGAISITQSTELGTVYSVEEIRALADFAHERGMRLHMDGARISNAAASLGLSPRAFTREAGVDVVSFGGTKNGLLGGEAVLFFDPAIAREFPFIRKQSMQLASKMRFVSSQFEALLTDDLYLKLARHANSMARFLAEEVGALPGIEILHPVQANAVFARMPKGAIHRAQAVFPFYIWDDATSIARWVCSFDTTEADIRDFARALREILTDPS